MQNDKGEALELAFFGRLCFFSTQMIGGQILGVIA